MAEVINRLDERPTLILCPNKTLAAQLTRELSALMPSSAVELFVSHFAVYVPEAFHVASNTYIPKTSVINEQLEAMRHKATRVRCRAVTRRRPILVLAVALSAAGCITMITQTLFHTISITCPWAWPMRPSQPSLILVPPCSSLLPRPPEPLRAAWSRDCRVRVVPVRPRHARGVREISRAPPPRRKRRQRGGACRQPSPSPLQGSRASVRRTLEGQARRAARRRLCSALLAAPGARARTTVG